MYSCTISLELPDYCKNIIMGGVTQYYVDQPRMIQDAVTWENMRMIRLLSIEAQRPDARHLGERLYVIQKTSSPNLKISLGHQIAAKGLIQWEIISRDIENLRTKLVVFCARENISITNPKLV